MCFAYKKMVKYEIARMLVKSGRNTKNPELKALLKKIEERHDVQETEEYIERIKASLKGEAKDRMIAYTWATLFFQKRFHIFTLRENDEVYYYEDGIYTSGGEKMLTHYLRTRMGLDGYLNNGRIREIVRCAMESTYISLSELQEKEPKGEICLLNGVLNLKTKTLREHSPADIFFTKLPI